MKYKLYSNNIFALYTALSSDLLFYIAISTVFLTSVKGLTDTEMSLLSTIAPLMYIVTQYPVLMIIKKIGNAKSIQLGCLFGLLTVTICTFSTNFVMIAISELCYQLSAMFKNMGSIVLKNNLKCEGKESDFTKIKSTGLSYYSIITAVIALTVGDLYGINKYLPMYLAILTALITFVISLFIKEYEPQLAVETIKPKFTFKIFTPLIICAFISSVLFMSPLSSMQSNSNLLRKNILETNLDDVLAVKILSMLVFVARMVRIVSCTIYKKTHEKIGKNIVPIMYIILFTAMALIVIGAIASDNFIIQVTLISIGYCLLLACRDPYIIFEEYTLLENTPKEYGQQILTYMSFFRKIAALFIGFIMTNLISRYELKNAIIFLYLIVLVGTIFCFVYFNLLKKQKNAK